MPDDNFYTTSTISTQYPTNQGGYGERGAPGSVGFFPETSFKPVRPDTAFLSPPLHGEGYQVCCVGK